MSPRHQKRFGAYYTPDSVVRTLVSWAVRRKSDRMLDPSCGDGRFLMAHPNSVGVEQDSEAASIVHERAPGSLIHQGDFFSWASVTLERFDCAAGNPPFIRYQRFGGDVRRAAQDLCKSHGVAFSSLSSSWAPFLVATATLLKAGGRMAFVVPAEIGHAPYAIPLLEYLAGNFSRVQVVAVREKLFPELSEDCWLLYADGYGGKTDHFSLFPVEYLRFSKSPPKPSLGITVSLSQWEKSGCRLRSFLLPSGAHELYQAISGSSIAERLGDLARVGIGYVTGANDFFHLRPSEAERLAIPRSLLVPAVRNGRMLTGVSLTRNTVETWERSDEPVLLLKLSADDELPRSVKSYLRSERALEAQQAFKCRTRDPWYAVPDVIVPDAFLTYMSGTGSRLVSNEAGCVATNSLHVVRLTRSVSKRDLAKRWLDPFTQLSCEIEGHPLGGGMLKLEPREAARVILLKGAGLSSVDRKVIDEAIIHMRMWRHHG